MRPFNFKVILYLNYILFTNEKKIIIYQKFNIIKQGKKHSMTVKLNLTHRNKKIQFTEKKKYRIKTEAVLRHFGLNILLREEIYSQNNSNIFRFSHCIFMPLQYFIFFSFSFSILYMRNIKRHSLLNVSLVIEFFFLLLNIKYFN